MGLEPPRFRGVVSLFSYETMEGRRDPSRAWGKLGLPFNGLVEGLAQAARYSVPAARYLQYGDEVTEERVFSFDPGWFRLGPLTTESHTDQPIDLWLIEPSGPNRSNDSSVRSLTHRSWVMSLRRPCRGFCCPTGVYTQELRLQW